MKKAHVNDFSNGWIVGNFEPSLVRTSEFEFGLKAFKKGQSEPRHFQHTAQEVTVVVSGSIRMGEHLLQSGDALLVDPHEVFDFEALTDCLVVAVKFPSVPSDKEVI